MYIFGIEKDFHCEASWKNTEENCVTKSESFEKSSKIFEKSLKELKVGLSSEIKSLKIDTSERIEDFLQKKEQLLSREFLRNKQIDYLMDEVKYQKEQIAILSSKLHEEQEMRKQSFETYGKVFDRYSENFQNQHTETMKLIENFEVEAITVQKILFTLSEVSHFSLQQEKAERQSDMESLRNEMKNNSKEFVSENLEKLRSSDTQTIHKRLSSSEGETNLNAQ